MNDCAYLNYSKNAARLRYTDTECRAMLLTFITDETDKKKGRDMIREALKGCEHATWTFRSVPNRNEKIADEQARDR